MNRRNMMTLAGGTALTLAAASLAPVKSFAQRGEGRMGEFSERYMTETLEVGSVALATSRLALERARDPWVRKFAQYEIAEQETIREVLRAMGGRSPEDERSEIADARRQLTDLSGRDFDPSYLEAQAEGHQRLLRIQENFIREGRNDEGIAAVARLARGQIREHIDLIRTIRDQIRA